MSSVPSTKSVMDGVDTLPTVVILLLATTSILPDILRNGGGPALERALEPGDRKAPSSDFGVPSMYERKKNIRPSSFKKRLVFVGIVTLVIPQNRQFFQYLFSLSLVSFVWV